MSTAFVAGNRDGLVFEDEEVSGYFPKKDELDGRDFSLEQELADCEKLVARLREQADDKALTSVFRKRALERLAEKAATRTTRRRCASAVGRERKLWLSGELTDAGMERAAHWGWPNTYTYTKSLGEQVMAQTPGLRYAIVRPVDRRERAALPVPRLERGLHHLGAALLRGHQGPARASPRARRRSSTSSRSTSSRARLIAITARAIEVTPSGASTSSPRATRTRSSPRARSSSSGSTGAASTGTRRPATPGSNELRSRVEPIPVIEAGVRDALGADVQEGREAAPRGDRRGEAGLGRAAGRRAARAGPGEARRGRGPGRLVHRADRAVPPVRLGEPATSSAATTPARSTRAWRAHDQARIPWDPEALDWRRYFLEVHLPGLEKWVFPGLEEETERRQGDPRLPRPARAVRRLGARVPPPGRLPPRRGREGGALHLRRGPPLRRPRRLVPARRAG